MSPREVIADAIQTRWMEKIDDATVRIGPPVMADAIIAALREAGLAVVLREVIAQLLAVARAYEQWEADLIMSEEAWGGAFPGGKRDFPTIPESLWERLEEIQTLRNAAMIAASEGE